MLNEIELNFDRCKILIRKIIFVGIIIINQISKTIVLIISEKSYRLSKISNRPNGTRLRLSRKDLNIEQ